MDGGHQGNSFLSTIGGTHIWTRHIKLMQLNSNENILYEKISFQIKKESYWNSIFMEKNRVFEMLYKSDMIIWIYLRTVLSSICPT